MLKKRIIAVLPVYQGVAVQSIGFNTYLPLGKPEIAIEFLNNWGIDEIIVLDISIRKNNTSFEAKTIQKLAQKCLVPLTYGGGINNLDDVHIAIHNGADKVSINHAVIHNPAFISLIAAKYGNQCVVASIDVIMENNTYKVFDYTTRKTIDTPLSDIIKQTVEAGAGELFINAVHRDGSYAGYDLELMQLVCNQVNIPTLACGGAKHPEHMYQLFQQTNVSAAVAGNFFHFNEHSVTISKKYLSEKLSSIRSETYFNYQDSILDNSYRLTKKDDNILEHLLYIKIDKEII
jgi:cyclase